MSTVRAEMVASVHSIEVVQGSTVSAGDTLMIMESMKMEIPVLAEHDGVVVEVSVKPGDVVQEGDALIVLG